jgi:hypothetical protein
MLGFDLKIIFNFALFQQYLILQSNFFSFPLYAKNL